MVNKLVKSRGFRENMAFTDFKSIAQFQQEYNIKYSEQNFISYLDLKPSEQFQQEFEFNLENILRIFD